MYGDVWDRSFMLLYLLFDAGACKYSLVFLGRCGMAWLPPCLGASSMARAERSPGPILLVFSWPNRSRVVGPRVFRLKNAVGVLRGLVNGCKIAGKSSAAGARGRTARCAGCSHGIWIAFCTESRAARCCPGWEQLDFYFCAPTFEGS